MNPIRPPVAHLPGSALAPFPPALGTMQSSLARAVDRQQQYGYRIILMDLLIDDGEKFRSFARSIDKDNETLSFSILVAAIDRALAVIREGTSMVKPLELSDRTKKNLYLGSKSNLGINSEKQDQLPSPFGPRTKNKLMDSWESLPESEAEKTLTTISYEAFLTSMGRFTGSKLHESSDQINQLSRFHSDGLDSRFSVKPSVNPISLPRALPNRTLRRVQSSRRRITRTANLDNTQSFRFQQHHHSTVPAFVIGSQVSTHEEGATLLQNLNPADFENPAIIHEKVKPETPSEVGEEECSVVEIPPSPTIAQSVPLPKLHESKISLAESTGSRRPNRGSNSSMTPPLRETDLGVSSQVLPEESGESALNAGDEDLRSPKQSDGSTSYRRSSPPHVEADSMEEIGDGSSVAPEGFLRHQSSRDDSVSVELDKQRFWEAEIAELEAQLDECEAEVDMLDDELMRYKKKYSELTDEFEKKRRAIVRLEERYASLKIEIARARSAEDDLEIDMTQAVMERDLHIVNLTNEINQLSVDYRKLRQEYMAVCRELTRSESTLARVQSQQARNKAASALPLVRADTYIIRSTL